MSSPTDKVSQLTLNTPLTPIEAIAEVARALDMSQESVVGKMPKANAHKDNLVITQLMNLPTVRITPEGVEPGDEGYFAYSISLGGKTIADTTAISEAIHTTPQAPTENHKGRITNLLYDLDAWDATLASADF
jgi:hypothetical protein